MSKYDWFEVWVDDTTEPPYLLILFSSANEMSFDIFNPQENRFRYSTNSYHEAMFSLTEDEYIKVDGRITLE